MIFENSWGVVGLLPMHNCFFFKKKKNICIILSYVIYEVVSTVDLNDFFVTSVKE